MIVTVGAAGVPGSFDYACDGTDDHVQLAAAIAAAGSGGTVQLSGGEFACAADITVLPGRSLVGTVDTTLAFVPGAARQLIARGNNAIASLSITGPCRLFVRASNVAVENVVSHQAVYGDAAFFLYAVSETLSGITFTDCHAIDTSGFGWYVNGEGTAPAITDVTLTRCTATNCGLSYDADNAVLREWVTGFNFAEAGVLTIGDIHAIDCTATRCYESGFHCERAPAIAAPCSMTRCTATDCGIDKPSPSFGAGLLATPSWTLTDCTATGCYRGFYIGVGSVNPHTGEVATLVRCEAVAPVIRGFHLGGGSGGGIVNPVLTDCSVSGLAAPGHVLWLDYVTGAQITNLRLTDCTGGIYTDHSSGNLITYYVAPFGVSPAVPYAGQEVAFTDLSENDGLASWHWDFGDGTTSTEQNPAHTFTASGDRLVTLTAGGNSVSLLVPVRHVVVFGTLRLSDPAPYARDRSPLVNQTEVAQGVSLQGAARKKRAWSFSCMAADEDEIAALDALIGRRHDLNIDGVLYPGCMIVSLVDQVGQPGQHPYTIGFRQEWIG